METVKIDRSTEKRIAGMRKSLEREKAKIAEARDRIREMLNEYSDIAENCDDALELIDGAADKLSELL